MTRLVLLVCVAVLSLASHTADASVLTVSGGEYSIVVQTSAATIVDENTESGSALGASFSMQKDSLSKFQDPQLGEHYGWAAASLRWGVSTAGVITTLSGAAGGIAEAFANGLDTFALGASNIRVYFDLGTRSSAYVESGGTFDTQLFMRQGEAWVQVLSLLGNDNLILESGSYRWDASAGATAAGTDFYSASAEFRMSVQPVPIPTSIVGIISALAASAPLLRRARKSSQ